MTRTSLGGPFAATVDRLVELLKGALPKEQVSCRLLSDVEDLSGVVVRLITLDPVRSGPAAARRARMACTFLVTIHDGDPIRSGEAIAAVLGTAGQRPEVEILPARMARALMKDIGNPAASGLLLRVPLEAHEAEQRDVALVRHPLISDMRFATTLTGLVRTPDGVRLPGVAISVAGAGDRARTDSNGAFALTLAATAASTSDKIVLTARRGTLEATALVAPDEFADIRLGTGG